MYLPPEGLDCPVIISTNNSRPKRSEGFGKNARTAKRCNGHGRHRRERSSILHNRESV